MTINNVMRGTVYVLGDNIDTDQILTAEYLKINPASAEGREELATLAMCGLQEGALPFINPQTQRAGYDFIVAGKNFGCGSSREHAVVALGTSGEEAVVAQTEAREGRTLAPAEHVLLLARPKAAAAAPRPADEPPGFAGIVLGGDPLSELHRVVSGTPPTAAAAPAPSRGLRRPPGLPPPGHTALDVLVPVPNLKSGIDWETVGPAYRRLVLERLKLLGLPDIEERIRYERVIDPRGWRDDFAVHEGATFNLAHDLMQMLYFRPHNRFGPGLYIVGGGTHPGSGLPVIYEGARITANLLLQDLGLSPARIPQHSALADAAVLPASA